MPLVLGGRAFTRATASSAGLSGRAVTSLACNGTVRQVVRGVYVDAGVPDDVHSRASAIALVLPRDAVLCRATVAWLLGIGDVRLPGNALGPPEIECVIPAGQALIRRRGLRCYLAPLESRDIGTLAGLACTTPLRTAVDLARWLPRPMGLAVVDAMLFKGLVDQGALVAEVERFSGDRGAAIARWLISHAEPLTESFGESWLRLRVMDAGFPQPDAQIKVRDRHGQMVYRLDLGYRGLRIGLEYDGDQHHGSSDRQRHDDARRTRLRTEFGWEVLGFDRGHVWGPRMLVERAVGELLNAAPSIAMRAW